MKALTIIALTVLTFHDQTIIAMQALKAKQEKFSDPYLAVPAKRPEGQEIDMIEKITDEDEKDELFKEIRQQIGDAVLIKKREFHLTEGFKAENVLNHFLPTLTALRDKILANEGKVATSNRAKIVDSRSKIELLCYAFEMFLFIEDLASGYSVKDKPEKKKKIWEIVTSAGIKDPMPTTSTGILTIALKLPMYQEIVGVRQITAKKELREMIEEIRKQIREEYNKAADSDPSNSCAAYNYLLKEFNKLVLEKENKFSDLQSQIKIKTLVTFSFLYHEVGNCFRMNESEAEKAKEDLWQKLKIALKTAPDIHYIQGERPNAPGQAWVLSILRQRWDPETRAFINPIFKRRK